MIFLTIYHLMRVIMIIIKRFNVKEIKNVITG